MTLVRDRVVVALDVEDAAHAAELATRIAPWAGTFKIGPGHVLTGPASLIELIKKLDRKLFVDLKVYDIPETVRRTCRQAARMGVDFITLHAAGGSRMFQAAREAAEECGTKEGRMRLLAVTVLTSFDEAQLAREWKMEESVEDRVLFWTEMAVRAGADGIVCSPLELASVRERFGRDLLTVVPGIRIGAGDSDDQRRTMPAGEAVKRGASMIVVGRPIVRSADPAGAAKALLSEIEEAQG